MRRNCFILIAVAVALGLCPAGGCQESRKTPSETQEALKAPAPAGPKPLAPTPKAVKPRPEPTTAEPKPVASKPQPVRVRPEPVRPKPSATEPNAAKPEIRFEKMVHDFGEIAPASTNICEFAFSNAGQGHLKIGDIHTDCGCTAFTLEKKDYAPGEKGTLKIKYHAATRPGPATRRVTVKSNDPVHPEVVLTMRADIRPRVVHEPARLNLLLKKDAGPIPEITLTSVDGKAFSIKSITSTANAITAEFDPAVMATKFILKPKVDKSRLQRVNSGIIQIAVAHPGATAVSIPFTALPRFKINPPVIIVFDARPGTSVIRRNVTVLSNYQEDFEIASTRSLAGSIKVLKQDKITHGYVFTLEITPPARADQRRFTDTFLVKIKDGDELKLTCQGFYARKNTATK